MALSSVSIITASKLVELGWMAGSKFFIFIGRAATIRQPSIRRHGLLAFQQSSCIMFIRMSRPAAFRVHGVMQHSDGRALLRSHGASGAIAEAISSRMHPTLVLVAA
jgi:hypothetical protein